jgi:hypothetical protein
VRAAAQETGALHSLEEFFSKDFNRLFLLCVVCVVIQWIMCLMFPAVNTASRAALPSVLCEPFWLWGLVKRVFLGDVE